MFSGTGTDVCIIAKAILQYGNGRTCDRNSVLCTGRICRIDILAFRYWNSNTQTVWNYFTQERKKTTRVLSVIYLIATAVIALGYSIFYVEVALPNGSTGQLLDIMDYISNSFMMPFISLLSAILIGWIMKPSWIAEEMELNGEKFKRKKLYNVMMRYIMPVIMVILFLQSTGVLNLIMK